MLLGTSPTTILWQTLALHLQVLTLNLAGEGFFVLFPSEMTPVWLSCFSLLLFSSAFPQITAELPVSIKLDRKKEL